MPEARIPSAYREPRGAYQERNIGVGEQIARLRETERMRQRNKRAELSQARRAALEGLPMDIHDEL